MSIAHYCGQCVAPLLSVRYGEYKSGWASRGGRRATAPAASSVRAAPRGRSLANRYATCHSPPRRAIHRARLYRRSACPAYSDARSSVASVGCGPVHIRFAEKGATPVSLATSEAPAHRYEDPTPVSILYYLLS